MPEDEIEIEPEEDYLSIDGICFFGGPEAELPSDVHIVAGIGVLDFIKDLIIKNPDGPGIKTLGWQPSDPIPEKVIGATVDMEILEEIQKANAGRGVLLKAPNIDTWMTLDEWNDIFATDGLAQAIKMRLYWQQGGGGVGTPGQRITGYHQIGHARKSAKEFKRLGKVI